MTTNVLSKTLKPCVNYTLYIVSLSLDIYMDNYKRYVYHDFTATKVVGKRNYILEYSNRSCKIRVGSLQTMTLFNVILPAFWYDMYSVPIINVAIMIVNDILVCIVVDTF